MIRRAVFAAMVVSLCLQFQGCGLLAAQRRLAEIEEQQLTETDSAKLEALKAEADDLRKEIEGIKAGSIAVGQAAGGATGIPGGAATGGGAVALAWAIREMFLKKKTAG